ncbi:unnamed protein product [Rotaria sordida]|uniref:Uncharacterized protein n=1 Tax=Rotaria sordida TaxID=392033 RepID=A0A814NH30_9BILA|nr:unnamed protein product [Rotaria sordida]CAF4082858.1 unnamed protein product [Rotaria sordida]
MDVDLDFCLKRFANEQLDDNIKEVAQLQRKIKTMRTKLTEISQEDDKAICQQENILADNFSNDLNKNNIAISTTRQMIENEFRKALDDIKIDIDIIAQIPIMRNNNRETNEEIRMASNKIRQQIINIDSELTHLFNMIDSNNSIHSCSRVLIWFRQHYGYINELNRIIGKNTNSGDLFAFSEKSPLMHWVMERAPLWIRRQKLIVKFIHEMDEDSITSKHLIDSLNRTTDTSNATKFIQHYIQDRQEARRHRREQLLHKLEIKLEEQLVEQQTRATELVSALCQLSARLLSEFQLNMKLKKVLHQVETSKQIVPILIDHNEEKKVDFLLIIRLEGNYNIWTSNKNSIQERFCSAFCRIMQVSTDSLRIDHIEESGVILHLMVHAPYGPFVIKQISGRGKDNEFSTLNIQTIQKCCAKFGSQIHSIVLGECTLPIEKCLMDFKWNKMRINDNRLTDNTYGFDSFDQENKESVCPQGWKRIGIKVADNDADFDVQWGSWHIAYHGTQGSYAPFILSSGLRVSTEQYFISRNHQTICLSPSIEYAAHPRHTRLWRNIPNDGEKYRYYQLVFQCRVNPAVIDDPKPETLLQDIHKTTRIDNDIPNEELEWIIQATQERIRNYIVCYGLMIRVIDCEPSDLPILNWWKNTHYNEY